MTASPAGACPLDGDRVVDEYFLENRAKLIDIAAFLDRVDRARDAERGRDDFRMRAFREALALLTEETTSGRAARLLAHFSDHRLDVPESAHGLKGAAGAAPPAGGLS